MLKVSNAANDFQSGFSAPFEEETNPKEKKHLNPASKNYRILSCFCCCLLCGCVAFWSRLSRLLCVALRDLLNARGFLFNHPIAFDFADVFLFVVVWCCFSFSYLRTFQLGCRALSQSNCQFWFEFRSFFFLLCFDYD